MNKERLEWMELAASLRQENERLRAALWQFESGEREANRQLVECPQIVLTAATYEQDFLPSEWCNAARAAGGGDE